MSREDLRMCGICRRVLAQRHYYAPGGVLETVWEHGAQDRTLDHEVVPIPVNDDALLARCDFCNVEVALPQSWTVPVADFPEIFGNNTEHWSRGDFAACDDCAEFVGAGRWGLLYRRVMDAWEARGGGQDPILAEFMLAHILAVRDSMKGPPYLESEV